MVNLFVARKSTISYRYTDRVFCCDLTGNITDNKLSSLFSSLFTVRYFCRHFPNTITNEMVLLVNIGSKHQGNYSGIQESIMYNDITLVLTELPMELTLDIFVNNCVGK